MKNVFITGASSGIGKATAKLLLDKGYKLTLTSRNIKRLEENGFVNSDQILLVEADVSNYNSIKDAISLSVDKFGGIDVLINNAGLGYFDPLEKAKIEEWHEMIDTNVKGVLNCLHAALPKLIESKGHVINLGSVASHQVFPNSGVYCASKWALLAISESLKVELQNKVKVTTISPGRVDTNFINNTNNEELKKDLIDYFAAGLRPETIAENILFAIEMSGKAVLNEIIIRPDLTV